MILLFLFSCRLVIVPCITVKTVEIPVTLVDTAVKTVDRDVNIKDIAG